MGNKFLLERALDNLISNAIRHYPINGNIEVKYEINEDHLCFMFRIKENLIQSERYL